MINAPCKDCVDRKVNCHSTCQKYIEFKKEKSMSNIARQKAVNLRQYDINRVERLKARKKK